MIDLDGIPNKERLGANAIPASRSPSRPAAGPSGLPLFRYVGGLNAHVLPVPMMNILNGGSHADPTSTSRSSSIAPIGAESSCEALRTGRRGRAEVGAEEEGPRPDFGDEGGFAPTCRANRTALDLIPARSTSPASRRHRRRAGLDVAASEFYDDGVYTFEARRRLVEEMSAYYARSSPDYPLVSIEDPLNAGRLGRLEDLTDAIGDKVQIVGDDLFVTNPERLARGIESATANALLVKVNQIGSLTETPTPSPGPPQRLPLHDEPPFRRDRGTSRSPTSRSRPTAARSRPVPRPAPERVAGTTSSRRIEEELDDAARYAGRGAFRASRADPATLDGVSGPAATGCGAPVGATHDVRASRPRRRPRRPSAVGKARSASATGAGGVGGRRRPPTHPHRPRGRARGVLGLPSSCSRSRCPRAS